MEKRTLKFYRDNEKEVMEKLGLKPTKNSGSGWIEKEDGQNDNIICQLKSTDRDSISIKLKDIEILEYNAIVSHKLPVFAIQFLKTNEVFLLVKPADLQEVTKYISTGQCNLPVNPLLEGEVVEVSPKQKKPVIKSNRTCRDEFIKQQEKEFKNRRKPWQRRK